MMLFPCGGDIYSYLYQGIITIDFSDTESRRANSWFIYRESSDVTIKSNYYVVV